MSRLSVLIISFYYPPYNYPGAIRIFKFVKFLREQGHEVRVIAANNASKDDSLKKDESKSTFIVNWIDLNNLPKLLSRQSISEISAITQNDNSNFSFKQKFLFYCSRFYRNLFNIPDSQIGFSFSAYSKAIEITKDWKPDLIFASSLPASVAVAGYRISKRLQIPLICEFRDLWTTNHYYSFPFWRKSIDSLIESKILKHSTGFVTVSEVLAKDIQSRVKNKPIKVIYNGFDKQKINETIKSHRPNQITKHFDLAKINIVYTGSLYKGRRDPSILFQALEILDKKYKGDLKIKVHFFGNDSLYLIPPLSKKYGVDKYILCHGRVSYNLSIQMQAKADLLLLLLWQNKAEDGVLTGKMFEYIGMKKQILAIGLQSNSAIKFINNHKLGIGSNNINSISQFLENGFNSGNFIPTNNSINFKLDDFSRESQSKSLEDFFKEILSA